MRKEGVNEAHANTHVALSGAAADNSFSRANFQIKQQPLSSLTEVFGQSNQQRSRRTNKPSPFLFPC